MAVLFPGKFIYLATPHTATISTTEALSKIPGSIPTMVGPNNPVKKRLRGVVIKDKAYFDRNTHHATKEELTKRYGEYFKGNEQSVTVVRNPYDLVVTWWLRQKGGINRTLFKRFRDKAHQFQKEPSFLEYLEVIDGKTSGGPYIRNGKMFWMEATEYLRYENLNEELNIYLKKFGINPIDLPRRNVTDKRPWRSYHTPETFRVINEKFGDEFTKFGYEIITK
jgi:hypothetical protein